MVSDAHAQHSVDASEKTKHLPLIVETETRTVIEQNIEIPVKK